MKYLCLIHMNEEELAAIGEPEISELNARHLELNDLLLASGKLIEAEALAPAAATATIHLRAGRRNVIDGPFTESKEVVAGFYLIEAADMDEAIDIAARIPSAPLASIEVRPTRRLVVDGREY